MRLLFICFLALQALRLRALVRALESGFFLLWGEGCWW
jgi:hypothetical protein